MLIMLTQKQMVRSCFVLLVILLFCAFLLASSGRRKSTEEVFLSHLVDPAGGKFDQDLGELLWISCSQDIMLLKEANEDLNHCIPEEGPFWSSQTHSKECIEVLLPLKQTLLDCARRNKDPFHGSGGSCSDMQYEDKPNLHRPHIPRRNLLQEIAMAPAPAPAVRSPLPPPAAAPDLKLVPSPLSPQSPPSTHLPFFPVVESSPPVMEDSSESVDKNDDNNNQRTIVIAVTVTAAVTFVFAALFFLCCTRLCKGGSGSRRNDERPLLSLSLSDYSVASSNKTFGYGSSIKEENLGNQSFGNNITYDGKGSSMDSNAYMKSDSLHASLGQTLSHGAIGGAAKLAVESFETSGNNNPLVPLPPGRMVGNPLLKPPPGREDLRPPEPPASLRPPPSKAGPPPPPPPAPPHSKATTNVAPSAPGPPPPPPMAPNVKPSPRPPPPPGLAPPRPPPPTPFGSKVPLPPLGSNVPRPLSEGASTAGNVYASKTKLKPFFWDKVLANPDDSMVWNQIKSGSFQFNEEMIEALFGAASGDKKKNDRMKESSSQDAAPLFVQILDPKKAQNLSIMLRALNVTVEEVCDALTEGNELPAELLQTLLKMAPTTEEELKLRLYSGAPSQLGPAERFLKSLVDIPFAYKRMEALLFMCTLQEEAATTKESFETLEVACKELRSSRLFLKLLEAVLKTGNRMNDGTFRGGAQAFKLDTLLKLADVKGTDGKTTLLHFVVQEIVRSEGVRAARAARQSQSFSGISVKTEDLLEEISTDTEEHYRGLGLQVVSRLSTELDNVKKAAAVDADNLTGTVAKLGHSLLQTREFMNKEMSTLDEDGGFHEILKSFVQNAEVDVMSLLEEEKRIMALVKSTGDYFHGNAGKDEGLRLFTIVRDFLIILDRVCKEVGEAQKSRAKLLKKEASTASSRADKKEASTAPSPADNRMHPSPDIRQRLFPAIAERRADDSDSSSSDDET